MAGSKYATKEEWLAAKRASKKAYTERKKAGLVAPAPAGRAKPGPKPKYASVEEKQAAVKGYNLNYRIRNEARIEARKAAKRAAAAEPTIVFNRDVQPLLHSPVRTRLFIAICERGPITIQDVRKYVSRTNTRTRYDMIRLFEDLGIVVKTRVANHVTAFYLNPGHPAYRELRAFGLRLAQEWPSPPRPRRDVEERPVPLREPVPCNLFGYQERTRTLLLVAVAGSVSATHAHNHVGLFQHNPDAGFALRSLAGRGIVVREAPPPKGARRIGGQHRPYRLDPDFFAYAELKTLLFALVATVYDEIEGLARALSLEDDRVAEAVREYEGATERFRPE